MIISRGMKHERRRRKPLEDEYRIGRPGAGAGCSRFVDLIRGNFDRRRQQRPNLAIILGAFQDSQSTLAGVTTSWWRV
jgi:hypothetical protein